MSEVVYHNQWPYYCNGGYYYGHFGYYPFGFSFSFGFGYPYYYGYSPYYYPYHSVYARYPYWGYYFVYPYPYLGYYPYYDCDYYDGYYVRYGYYRQSYYVTCSGYGYHGHHDHHCHSFECGSHGHHCYHLRDCDQCYPAGDPYVHNDVEVPAVAPASTEAEAVSPPAEPQSANAEAATGTVGAIPEVARVETAAASAPVDQAEAFFAGLKPAQLSFTMGLLQFRSARYDEAVESLYNASLEDPESKLVRVFLGISLFAIGEYSFAADYLRAGLEEWPAFPRFQWDVRQLYSAPADFDEQLATLEEEVAHNPAAGDPVLVLAFLQMSRGSSAPEKAGQILDQGRALAVDDLDRSILDGYIAEVERRHGGVAGAVQDGVEPTAAASTELSDASVQSFLSSFELRDVPALPIR